MQIIHARIKPELRKEFCVTHHNKTMYEELGDVWEIYWSETKGDYRTVKYEETNMGWYITTHELERYFDIIPREAVERTIDPNSYKLEKVLVLNDLRVTKENMEEVIENIRKMLA